MHSAHKNLIYAGLLIAGGIALQYIEQLFGIVGVLPGLKPGLANMVTILALDLLGIRMALCITCLRCLLGALLFSGVSSVLYAVPGGLTACLMMYLLMRSSRFGTVGISISGAFANNVCQTAISAVMLQNASVLSYLWLIGPQSLLFGVFTGLGAYFSGNVLKQHRKRGVEI